jgi:hypothetical protein
MEAFRADDAKADGGWRKTDMALLGKVATALHLKKIDELDQVNRTRESTAAAARDLEDQGLVSSDADDEQVAEFRKTWIARWSGNYGSFDDISEFHCQTCLMFLCNNRFPAAIISCSSIRSARSNFS